MPHTPPPGPPRRFARALDAIDRVLPRAEDLGPAVLAALIGLLPLAAARAYLASTDAGATARDLWRITLGEIQAWSILAVVGAVFLRVATGRGRGFVRVGLHAFATVLLLLSIAEVVFYATMGNRVDWELLAFAAEDAPQVAPVFFSEVKAWHLAAVFGALALGLAPALVRFRPGPRWVGRLVVLLVAVPLLVEAPDGRPSPKKALRTLQPSLIEQLWWDGLERFGDDTLPADPATLTPIRLVRDEERPPFNVVLVLLESTGARATSVYRPELANTPNLERLAREGFWVRHASSVVPHTSKSIVATMCGSWPQLHSEIHEAKIGGLPGRCLPDLLRELGFRTAFFQTADERFESRGSLVHHLGFQKFLARDTLRGDEWATVNYFGHEDDAMLKPGLEWSTQPDPRPFFATYLTLTSHHDYGVPPDWPIREFPGATAREAEYLNAVAYVDAFLGKLVEGYRAAGLLENTLFVILGDHGEAFGEHGRSMHDLVIWEEGIAIPMVLWGPGVLDGSGVIEGQRQQIDVLPTVLDLLGVRAEGGYLPGASLFADVAEDRTLKHSCWRSHRCLARREGPLKVIDHYRDAPMQVFDLATDPLEKKDLRAEKPEPWLDQAREDLRTWRARVNGRYEAVLAAELARRQTPDASPALANWAGKMDLLGCSITTFEVLPGEAVWVKCRWRATETIRQAWRVDLRLEGAFEPVLADVRPLDGLLPTFKWTPGLAVEDEHRAWIPQDARPGPAEVFIGWERLTDGAIEMSGGGERFRIGTVTVLPRIYPYSGEADEGVAEAPSEDPKATVPAAGATEIGR